MANGMWKEERAVAGHTMVWVTIAVIFVLALSAGIWVLDVGSSGVRGRGDVIRTNNSAINRIGQQSVFEDLNADYTGSLIKINAAERALATAKKSGATAEEIDIASTNLEGLQQNCIDSATQYNANSHKVTAKDWKSPDLPYTLDPNSCTGR